MKQVDDQVQLEELETESEEKRKQQAEDLCSVR